MASRKHRLGNFNYWGQIKAIKEELCCDKEMAQRVWKERQAKAANGWSSDLRGEPKVNKRASLLVGPAKEQFTTPQEVVDFADNKREELTTLLSEKKLEVERIEQQLRMWGLVAECMTNDPDGFIADPEQHQLDQALAGQTQMVPGELLRGVPGSR